MNITLVLGYLAKGGTERQVAYLSTGLVQRGHQVRILLLGRQLEDDYPVAVGVQIVPLQITKLRHCVAGFREIRSAFRTSDVVYSFLDIANVLCALCKPKGGASLVWGLRAANTSPGWLSQLGLSLSQRLVSRAEALIANSQAVRDYYRGRDIGGASTLVVANGVLPRTAGSVGNALRHELQLPKQSFVALVLARAATEKRQELGLKLLAQHPTLHIVFAGDGVSRLPTQWQDESLAPAALLGRCRFLEHQEDVARLLDGADVLLSLSAAEGLPNAVLEAMASGLPVVATAVGGVVELLADELGWLVPSSGLETNSKANLDLQVAGLVQALIAVQNGGLEVQKRTVAAQQKVESDFGVERMIDQTVAHLEQLASSA